MIDVAILLGSFVLLCLVGMPVAYTLGLAAIVGALWIDVPLEAVMIQVSSGVNSFSLLAIPFFVLAGAIMAEGGMAVRLVNLARIFVGAVRGGLVTALFVLEVMCFGNQNQRAVVTFDHLIEDTGAA